MWATPAGGGNTLGEAYNEGGAAAGRTIDVDLSNPVLISGGGSPPSTTSTVAFHIHDSTATTSNVEMTISSGTNGDATINFGDSSDEDVFKLSLNNVGNLFTIGASIEFLKFNGTGGETVFNETGNAALDVRIEGDTLAYMFFTDATGLTENIALLTTASPSWQNMDRGIFLGDSSNAPTGSPSAGAFLWSDSGVPKIRQSGGLTGPIVIGRTSVYTRDATIVEDRTLLASASATAINNNNVLAALIADLTAALLIT